MKLVYRELLSNSKEITESKEYNAFIEGAKILFGVKKVKVNLKYNEIKIYDNCFNITISYSWNETKLYFSFEDTSNIKDIMQLKNNRIFDIEQAVILLEKIKEISIFIDSISG